MLIRRSGMISRTYRHLQRYRQILAVLAKYGFADLIQQIQVPHFRQSGLRLFARGRPEEKRTRSERVRQAFEEMGPNSSEFISTGP